MHSLLLIAALCVAVASAGKPRGMMTTLEKHYDGLDQPGAKFTCLSASSGATTIPAAYVNDEYCDCEDGSDEPGTAACSYVERFPKDFKFQCTNEGFEPQYFFHSRVNDGICDCCDGSDEYLGKVTCPNHCAEVRDKLEREHKEREQRRQQGLEARKEMVAKAARLRKEKEEKLAAAKKTVEDGADELAGLLAKKEAAEAEERKEREAIHEKSLKEKEQWEKERAEKASKSIEVEEQKPTEEAAVADTPAPEGEEKRITEGHGDTPPNYICTKWRQTKHCNGKGVRDSDFDKDCDVLIEGGWSGFCECVDLRTGQDEMHYFDCNHKRFTCNRLCEHEGKETGFADEGIDGPPGKHDAELPKGEEFKVDDGSNHHTQAANEARAAYNAANEAKNTAQREISDLEQELAKDYGPDHALLALVGECFSKEDGEYVYKMCPYNEVRQEKRGGGYGGSNLGRWKGWAQQTYAMWGGKQDLSKAEFTGGDHCYNGPARSTDVVVLCGPTNEVVSIEEPSMCVYKMVFHTPAVCE